MRKRFLKWWMVVAAVAISILLTPHGSLAQSTGPTIINASPPLYGEFRTVGPVVRPGATGYSVFTLSEASPHEVWYRVSGGDALYLQRLQVYTENARPRPQNELPPESNRVHDLLTNEPTGWYLLDIQRGPYTYYFDGDHRRFRNAPWRDALGTVAVRTDYTNGSLYQIQFEDIPELDDYDDLQIEVAVVYNR